MSLSTGAGRVFADSLSDFVSIVRINQSHEAEKQLREERLHGVCTLSEISDGSDFKCVKLCQVGAMVPDNNPTQSDATHSDE